MSEQKKITVAIDGFSSCGKSTLAKALAQELGYLFIDTGAMYRGIAYYALHNGIIENGRLNSEKLIQKLDKISIAFGEKSIDGSRPLLLNNLDISKEIRSLEVSSWVSEVAQLKPVREKLVKEQQRIGANGGVIMDGRDIGSVVFPNAELKLFVTASPDIRAERRFSEMLSKGERATLEEVKANLVHRDHLDSTRKESPLTQTADAVVLDNTNLNQEEQLYFALNIIQKLIELKH